MGRKSFCGQAHVRNRKTLFTHGHNAAAEGSMPIPSHSPNIAESLSPVYRYPAMVFADLDLSQRLERAEGHACLEFAESRHHLDPESGAAWMQCAGANVVF